MCHSRRGAKASESSAALTRTPLQALADSSLQRHKRAWAVARGRAAQRHAARAAVREHLIRRRRERWQPPRQPAAMAAALMATALMATALMTTALPSTRRSTLCRADRRCMW